MSKPISPSITSLVVQNNNNNTDKKPTSFNSQAMNQLASPLRHLVLEFLSSRGIANCARLNREWYQITKTNQCSKVQLQRLLPKEKITENPTQQYGKITRVFSNLANGACLHSFVFLEKAPLPLIKLLQEASYYERQKN